MNDQTELLIYNDEYQTKIIENGKVLNSIIVKDVIVSKDYELTLNIRPNLFFDKKLSVVVSGMTMGSSDYQLVYEDSYFQFDANTTTKIVDTLKEKGFGDGLKAESKPKEIFAKIENVINKKRSDGSAEIR